MRWYGQLAVIVVLGGAGYGGWEAWKAGRLEPLKGLPGVGPYVAMVLPPPPMTAAQIQGQKAAQSAASASAAPVVEVDSVGTGRIVEVREAVGTVRAFESITVTAKVSGAIREIPFNEGEKVSTGDVLVRFDTEERRADIEGAAAEIARATAQRDEVRTRLERAMQLRRTGAGTEAQVNDLTAQVKTLESAIASAAARRRAAEARLDDLIIRAPFAGRLGMRAVSLGAYVSPGTRMTTLDDLSKVRLDFSVPENLLGQVRPDLTVRARSAAFGARVFNGQVTIVDPRVDPVTRSVRLTADFDNPDEALKPGMFLSVSLEVTTRDNAVVVPEEAVVSEGLRHVIFAVVNNKIDRRVAMIGQRQGGKVEILEGVAAGDTIVVRGVQRVRAGMTVKPQQIAKPQTGPQVEAPGTPPAPTPPRTGEAPSRSQGGGMTRPTAAENGGAARSERRS